MTSDPSAEELHTRLRQLPVFAGDLADFDVSHAPTHPAELFLQWLTEAIDADVPEPHAMTLSTVDHDGRPNSRVLILKGLSDGRWEFATSRASRKGAELSANSHAALSFYWSQLGRQVRIRGRVLDAGAQRSSLDFLARSPGARAEALAGTQSAVLSDPADLDAALCEANQLIRREPQVVDENWALYGLVAEEVEFWQAHPERRHTRLHYFLRNGAWLRELLWP